MKIFFPLAFCLIVLGCDNKKPAPDVSDIKVDIQLKRFDKDLFSIDTNNIEPSLNKLQEEYGTFLNDYLYNIMVLAPQPDTVKQKIKMYRIGYLLFFALFNYSFDCLYFIVSADTTRFITNEKEFDIIMIQSSFIIP